MSDRLYVLVRQDLSAEQQSVQAGHAVAQFCLTYPEIWKNHILIYLSVNDYSDLNAWKKWISLYEKKYVVFYEPYYQEETALAVSSSEELFEGVPLMRFYHDTENNMLA